MCLIICWTGAACQLYMIVRCVNIHVCKPSICESLSPTFVLRVIGLKCLVWQRGVINGVWLRLGAANQMN